MTAYAVIMIYCGYKLHIKVTERIYSTTTKRFIKIYQKKNGPPLTVSTPTSLRLKKKLECRSIAD